VSVPDKAVISYVIDNNAMDEVVLLGLTLDDFVSQYRNVWKYLTRVKTEHGEMPSRNSLHNRFPELRFTRTSRRDVAFLNEQMKVRRKHNDFVKILNEVELEDFDAVDEALPQLQRKLASLSSRETTSVSHLVDVFNPDTTAEMLNELKSRAKKSDTVAIPTGLKSFDASNGGLRPQQMCVVMGRTSSGKSWIDLLFVANAVNHGHKVLLYPLEMTLAETAFRLYTIFTQQFGSELGTNSRVLRNMDLNRGKIDLQEAKFLLELMQDKYQGLLVIADIAQLNGAYTIDRIEAEVEQTKPAMFWVDYLTLLKSSYARNQGWEEVQLLSGGIKRIAMRYGCVGGCSAQVNRDAVKSVGVFLPHLEHISFGDSIGHDADVVFSLRKDGGVLHWALVKNRGGKEIGHRRIRWNPDEGIFKEIPKGREEEDDE
jgi:replicative DNA helicase